MCPVVPVCCDACFRVPSADATGRASSPCIGPGVVNRPIRIGGAAWDSRRTVFRWAGVSRHEMPELGAVEPQRFPVVDDVGLLAQLGCALLPLTRSTGVVDCSPRGGNVFAYGARDDWHFGKLAFKNQDRWGNVTSNARMSARQHGSTATRQHGSMSAWKALRDCRPIDGMGTLAANLPWDANTGLSECDDVIRRAHVSRSSTERPLIGCVASPCLLRGGAAMYPSVEETTKQPISALEHVIGCRGIWTGPAAVKSTPSTVIDHPNCPEFKLAFTSASVGAAATQAATSFTSTLPQPTARTTLSHPGFWL